MGESKPDMMKNIMRASIKTAHRLEGVPENRSLASAAGVIPVKRALTEGMTPSESGAAQAMFDSARSTGMVQFPQDYSALEERVSKIEFQLRALANAEGKSEEINWINYGRADIPEAKGREMLRILENEIAPLFAPDMDALNDIRRIINDFKAERIDRDGVVNLLSEMASSRCRPDAFVRVDDWLNALARL